MIVVLYEEQLAKLILNITVIRQLGTTYQPVVFESLLFRLDGWWFCIIMYALRVAGWWLCIIMYALRVVGWWLCIIMYALRVAGWWLCIIRYALRVAGWWFGYCHVSPIQVAPMAPIKE